MIFNITSGCAYCDPKKPAGKGGWGMGYSLSKGALQRVAGLLKVEHEDQGILCFNLQPGFVMTERMAQDMGKFGFGGAGAPPEVPAKVVRWLCTSPEAKAYTVKTIEAQEFCHERGLLPGWAGPYVSNADNIDYDLSGYYAAEINKAARAKA